MHWKAVGDTGTAGKLKLQLVDTAANTGAGQPIAHASVDLDMRQWKDSQTYQAEVSLASDQVKCQSASTMVRGNGCCLQECPARLELHSLVSLRTCGHGLQQKYLNMPGHISSWIQFMHEHQKKAGLRNLPSLLDPHITDPGCWHRARRVASCC